MYAWQESPAGKLELQRMVQQLEQQRFANSTLTEEEKRAEPVVLNCSVCLEAFHHSESDRQPRLLPCCHSFCTFDCQRLIQNGQIQCSTCRYKTKITALADLKLNFALIELLEYILDHPHLQPVSSSSSSNQPMCTFPNCKQYAVCHCFNDEEDLCDVHRQQMHTTEAHKKHKIVPIHEKLKHMMSKPKSCHLHHSPLALWCEQCQVLCCPTCYSHGSHRGHHTVLVDEIASSQRQQLRSTHDQQEAVSHQLEQEAGRLLGFQTAIDQSVIEVQAAITRQFDEAIQLLQQRKQYMHGQLQESASLAKKELEFRMLELSGCRSHWTSFSSQCLLSLDTPDYEFLTHITAIRESLSRFQAATQAYKKECENTQIALQFELTQADQLQPANLHPYVSSMGNIHVLKHFRAWGEDKK